MSWLGLLGAGLAGIFAIAALAFHGQAPPTEQEPAGEPAAGLSQPEQAEIIKNLLRAQERSRIVLPQEPGVGVTTPESLADQSTLLLEGTVLVERPGRLVLEADRPMFVFIDERTGPRLQAMELLPNQLLEAMEREAEGRGPEFTISARVTQYKGRNYLLLTKVLRRVEHGNVGP